MKYFIALWNRGSAGKTESIRQTAFEFMRLFPGSIPVTPTILPVPATGDFRLVVDVIIRGVQTRVAFESQGDPNTTPPQRERLTWLITYFNADIIFCTCRTRGETADSINDLSRYYGYDVIWDSTYYLTGHINTLTNREVANQQKGQHIISLLQTLNIL